AGDARFHAMAREIAVYRLVVEPVFRLGVNGVRPRADQRQVALEHDVEQLRQLIKRSLADEGSDAGHARVSLRYKLRCGRIALIDIHGAELVDFDQLVIETVAFLLEQHCPTSSLAISIPNLLPRALRKLTQRRRRSSFATP